MHFVVHVGERLVVLMFKGSGLLLSMVAYNRIKKRGVGTFSVWYMYYVYLLIHMGEKLMNTLSTNMTGNYAHRTSARLFINVFIFFC